MTGINNMQNSAKSEKSRGVVIFATNTAETDYVAIAKQNARLVEHFLGLPATIVSAVDTGKNSRFNNDIGKFVEWKNYGRHEAYRASPYDETLVLDADYLIFDDSLNQLFDCTFDYLLFNTNRYVNIAQQPSVMGPHSLPFIWATAFAFRKTEPARLFFELVEKIRHNYDYYRLLYNIRESNFRNDYAFAIADYILKGNILAPESFAPFPISTVTGIINSIEYSTQHILLKTPTTGYVLPCANLHVMSKSWLTSPALKNLVDQCLDNSTETKGS